MKLLTKRILCQTICWNRTSALSGNLKAVYLIVKEDPGINTRNLPGIRNRAEDL